MQYLIVVMLFAVLVYLGIKSTRKYGLPETIDRKKVKELESIRKILEEKNRDKNKI